MDRDRTSNGKFLSTEDAALHGGKINRRSSRLSKKTDCFYYKFDLIDSDEEWGKKRLKKRPKKEGKTEMIRKGFIATLEDDKDWVGEDETRIFRVGKEREIRKIDGTEKIRILESDGGPVCDMTNEMGDVTRHSNGEIFLGNGTGNVLNEKRKRSKKIEPGGLLLFSKSDAANYVVSTKFCFWVYLVLNKLLICNSQFCYELHAIYWRGVLPYVYYLVI